MTNLLNPQNWSIFKGPGLSGGCNRTERNYCWILPPCSTEMNGEPLFNISYVKKNNNKYLREYKAQIGFHIHCTWSLRPNPRKVGLIWSMPLSEYIVLTDIFEYLETPNVQCGDMCTRLFTRQSQIANSIGLWKLAMSILEDWRNTTHDSGSLRLRHTADRYSLSGGYGFWMRLVKYRGENSGLSQCRTTAFAALCTQ